ncbi:MAG: nucleotidyltransferase domain-containing protein [Pseudobutyrivibrio sp.]|nr:nucleotidyltransferase domain-containing protein [Pseudobutyrivibrio sp.]
MNREEIISQMSDICLEFSDILGMVVLFGSFSRGEQTPDSDVDLYIEPKDVKTTTAMFRNSNRYRSFRRRIYSSFPQEFDFLAFGGKRDITNVRKSKLWQQIEKDGIVLYDKRAKTL